MAKKDNTNLFSGAGSSFSRRKDFLKNHESCTAGNETLNKGVCVVVFLVVYCI